MRRVHAARPRRQVRPPDDEQPDENRGAQAARRRREAANPDSDPRDGLERAVPRDEAHEDAPPDLAQAAQVASRTAMTWSPGIDSPSRTRTSRTRQSAGAGISFCIFIASRT